MGCSIRGPCMTTSQLSIDRASPWVSSCVAVASRSWQQRGLWLPTTAETAAVAGYLSGGPVTGRWTALVGRSIWTSDDPWPGTRRVTETTTWCTYVPAGRKQQLGSSNWRPNRCINPHGGSLHCA
jgi:hypothetical protein